MDDVERTGLVSKKGTSELYKTDETLNSISGAFAGGHNWRLPEGFTLPLWWE